MNKFDDNVINHVKDGDVEYIEFKILNKYNINHCITLRHGGVSKNEHESLNFRIAGTDSRENVLENLQIIRNKKEFSPVYKATQAHTDKVIVIESNNKEKYSFENIKQEEVDGYIVDERGIATLITTADCNPVIILDKANRVVANVHAGWKGVINKIYIKAIQKMIELYGTRPEDIIVCIGPSIRKCCFSSEEESFKEKFTSVFNYKEEYLEYEKNSNRFHIDLIKILKHELEEIDVKEDNIYVADICTRCNTKDFFSYRYCVQNNYKDYGTMATIVEIM